ncbi:GNAT family N-acetyltransferase [Streptacidiphilus sp. PB12-B1b]|uniref:GNAT family N-acetyltransferase n=1 Tax=Streptacidiphilus sp. PB12-B1b TaxID=2705012 RepID=UPI0015F86F1B|nr:GNAT family N-acetyltransferase [Streptacidiphilus sp. PB12-B1b]QMU74523.1 GNAT family N-acetyltransferase [Streptacidiphilus sp. PB12-B1b]
MTSLPGAESDAYTWRPITSEDVEAWVLLLAAIEAVDQVDEHIGAQDLRDELADPYMDFPRGSIAAFDTSGAGAMVAYCTLRARAAAQPVHEPYLVGAVHPEHRNRGLGSWMLGWAERAAPPLHEERYPGQPLTLYGTSVTKVADAVSLFADHGYRAARWFNGMALDLRQDLTGAAGDPPPGVVLVPYAPERSDDGRLVRNEAFRDHWGSTEISPEGWAHLVQGTAFRAEYTWLAYEADEAADSGLGEVLGMVLGEEFTAHQDATGRRDLYVALVGTRRAARKRGIASALLAHVLRKALADGFDTASLGVDCDSPTGATGLYERIGFRAVDSVIAQLKPLIPVPGAVAAVDAP